ncbi:hypothetical protein NJ7G_2853 [Natrinema sp. J7-2]|nr:hypothetical protein NJ7G_2853 [Natrinema sp. J7-2]
MRRLREREHEGSGDSRGADTTTEGRDIDSESFIGKSCLPASLQSSIGVSSNVDESIEKI